jgi:two-component system sensor histidine kinase HydH
VQTLDPTFSLLDGEVALNPLIRDEERALLHALVQATDYGILVSDLERQDLIANRRLGELFGMAPHEVVETDPHAVRRILLSRVVDPEECVRRLEAVYADPEFAGEDEMRLTGEPERILRRSTAPLRDRAGRPIARLWTFLDVTENRRLQAEVERLRAAATLSATIAHDVRNILTPLQIDLAQIDDRAAEPIRQQINRFHALLHQLLALSRPRTLELGPTSLPALVQRVADLVRGQAAVQGVDLEVSPAPDLPLILGDPDRLEHLLVNLCLNGIDAMAEAGGKLTIEGRADAGIAEIAVTDTGRGISPEHLSHLFEPFFTTRPNGTGLGLFSCRQIAEEHGGTLSVESAPGRGARFTLRLPAARQEAP